MHPIPKFSELQNEKLNAIEGIIVYCCVLLHMVHTCLFCYRYQLLDKRCARKA